MTNEPTTRIHAFSDDALGDLDAVGVAAAISCGQISAREAAEAKPDPKGTGARPPSGVAEEPRRATPKERTATVETIARRRSGFDGTSESGSK